MRVRTPFNIFLHRLPVVFPVFVIFLHESALALATKMSLTGAYVWRVSCSVQLLHSFVSSFVNLMWQNVHGGRITATAHTLILAEHTDDITTIIMISRVFALFRSPPSNICLVFHFSSASAEYTH